MGPVSYDAANPAAVPPQGHRAVTARGELHLRTRDDGALELRVNGVFVMDTAETTSEITLAEATLSAIANPDHVLIGGLGLGFTLRAVLADERVRRVTVVEIEEPVIEWMTSGVIPGGPPLLNDPRVEVVAGDVAEVIRRSSPAYDVILLDTDNGPGNLVHPANAAIYEPPLLQAAKAALKTEGTLAIWSSHQAPNLEEALRNTFSAVEAIECPVDLGSRCEVYYVYVGRC